MRFGDARRDEEKREKDDESKVREKEREREREGEGWRGENNIRWMHQLTCTFRRMAKMT